MNERGDSVFKKYVWGEVPSIRLTNYGAIKANVMCRRADKVKWWEATQLLII